MTKKSTTLSLPVDLVKRLDRVADEDRRDRSNMATLLLEKALDEIEAAQGVSK